MLKAVFACFALAAVPLSAATAQTAASSDWTVSGSANGCILYGASASGTVFSILAGPGQQNLLVLVQNREWALRDGSRHALALAFDGATPYEVEAVARTNLDNDGPGLIFPVSPAEASGKAFLAGFAAAGSVQIGQDGRALDRVDVRQGRNAMGELAQCMGAMWDATSAVDGQEAAPTLPGSAATRIKL